ncbi:PAS domain S-box-containing protein [Pararhizobium capsulatum DSM 1112]|uniref:PAS domain S-box-containing protein n=1 Tax=Pararhizobium capsulatum DSM 1112 TaxID=1121113 RepID=A0ABU0BM64_9HYPH|nr:response regulator [Pararhizobium capsulatum]MDQ0319334.1 PAS domain S-box-containing protein [Pararhizobium capsulatum DSM 1112]
MTDVASSGADIHGVTLEATLDALGLAILVCDKNDEFVFASRPILQLFAIAPEFIAPGTRLRDFLGAVFDVGLRGGTSPEKSRRRVNRDDWIAERISHHWRERYETVQRLGQQRWVSVRMRRLPTGMGVVSFTDISEQKKREEQLQIDMDRVGVTENILDDLPNPIFVKDRGLTYVGVNKAFCTIHGILPEAILGRSAWDLVDPELAEKFEISDRHVLETGEMFSLAEQIVRNDGEDIWVLTRKFRIGEAGKHMLVTCMSDVTDLVAGREIDINEPLRIKDFDAFEPAQNCYDPFRSIDVQHLREAVSIIEPALPVTRRALVMSHAEVFEQSLVPQLRKWGFDACAVTSLDELMAFGEIASASSVAIDILLVDAASTEIRAILSAWNASPFLLVGRDWRTAELHADITALLANVEAPQVEAHGLPADWDIIVSEPGEQAIHVAEVDVIVAEDNEINQFVFAQILEGLGISYRIAANGEEAVRLWQQHRPNLVLMDVAMPVMNGFDAALAIRAAEGGGSTRTPIIAVTTPAIDLDVERSRAAGMDDHITKPISPDMIEAVYRKYVASQSKQEQLTA